MVYIAVVQAVMLYGLETWVMSPRIDRALGGFHHKVARILTLQQPRRRLDGMWLYRPLAEEIVEQGLQEVETYVSRLQNTVAQYIATGPIMDLCMAEGQHPGKRLSKQWWGQGFFFLEDASTEALRVEQ